MKDTKIHKYISFEIQPFEKYISLYNEGIISVLFKQNKTILYE